VTLSISIVEPGAAAPRDVVLGVDAGTPLGEVADALGELTGTDRPPLYLDGGRLDPDEPLGATPLRDGAVLGVGAPAGDGGRAPAGPVQVHGASGADAGRTWRLPLGEHDVGRDERCAVRLGDERVPGVAATLLVCPDGSVRVRPVAPGVVLQGAELNTERIWPSEQFLQVGGSLLAVGAPARPDGAVRPCEGGIGLDFNRPPRILPVLRQTRFRLPTPPPEPSRRGMPILMTLAPLVFALIMVIALRSYFFLMFSLFSPLFVLTSHISDRRSGRRGHRAAMAAYRAHRKRLEAEAQAAVEAERVLVTQAVPDPAEVAAQVCGPGRRLWERRRTDPDRLVLRIGTGDIPSEVELLDPTADEHRREVRWTLHDVPVGVATTLAGVVGLAAEETVREALGRWWVAQLAALHSPHDLRIHLLTDAGGARRWQWVRWLPHLRPGDPAAPQVTVGADPETVANRVTELAALVSARHKVRSGPSTGARAEEPDIVVVLDGARLLRDVPGVVSLLRDGPAVGVYLLCLEQQEKLLPEECTAVVRQDGPTVTLRQRGAEDLTGIRPDLVDGPWCDRVARAMAGLRGVTASEEVTLPASVRLLDLLGLDDPAPRELAARWRQRPASTRFTLGAGFDGPLELDLVRDGPHALVAGTTGAGKSELLQTMVASLAAANRPDELVFVLVDYKGGSAFKDCVALPHTLGMVTDLDAHLVQRALTSLGAELRRREHVLAATGSKDVTEYQAARATNPGLPPLPRLVLVIDEFATMVREVPDFIPGLVGIAQRGRSLGLHLVLATQRPSGAISGDIRANTNLRIALRTTDGAESYDIIDCTHATAISPATPGRALVRTTHGSAVPFQTGYVGDASRPEAVGPAGVWAAELPWHRLGRRLVPPEQPAAAEASAQATDLTRLVAAIAQAATDLGIPRQQSPWLPPLDERLLVADLPGPLARPQDPDLPAVAWALEDRPAEQRQDALRIDLASFEHLYVTGASRSGRSQVLRTMAGALAGAISAEHLHLYAIDAGGGALAGLAELPHCGAVVRRGDLERIERLLARLLAEVAGRQDALSRQGCGTLAELRQAREPGHRPPHIMLLLDGWENFLGAVGEHDNGRLQDEVIRLMREGASVGVHLVITADRSLLGGRMSGLNDNRLVLRMSERSDFTLIGLSSSKVPSYIPPGRGWRSHTLGETQVALLSADATGPGQTEAIRALAEAAHERDAAVPQQRRPAAIGKLPESVSFREVFSRVPPGQRRPLVALVGVGGDDLSPVCADLAGRSNIYGVAGPPGSGRSSLLLSMSLSLLANGAHLVLVTPRESPLRRLAAHPRVLASFTDPATPAADLAAVLDAAPGPTALVLDDVDLLTATALDPVLRSVVATGRDRALALLYAGTGDVLTQAAVGWLGDAKRARTGALLAPQSAIEGDLLGIRLPANLLRRPPQPGRAWTADPRTHNPTAVIFPRCDVSRSDRG
jgi:DNA segregation ATPase FtsK/SpoIIIE, S-DNA-T family